MFENFKLNKYYIIFSICIILLLFLLNKNNKETKIKKNYKIIYISPEKAYKKIIKSGYLNKLNKKDMEIRKCNNLIKCKELYKNNLIEFDIKEKKELERLIILCNNKLEKYGGLYNVPWKLCKFTKKIEEGMPHTHNDIIFLSHIFFTRSDNSKITTLIHEKLHVYQRMNKKKTLELYNQYSFSKVYKKHNNLRRNNPDLDSYDYNYNGVLIYSEYKENAKNLRDVNTKLISSNIDKNKEKKDIEELETLGYQNEHPNEIFASLISDKIVKDVLNEKLTNYIK